jgi:RNA polymerase sigma-19 factor, ECF subfamily
VDPPTDKKPKNSARVEETIRAYDRELRGFLLRRLRDQREFSEDIRQEIYLRMLRFTDTDLVKEPRAYLYRVARNVLHDRQLLWARERATFDSSADGVMDQGITEDESTRVDKARDVERIVAQLPPLYRAVLLLRTTKGLSYGEIAKELGISVHTVKKYLRLALVECRLISLSLGLR